MEARTKTKMPIDDQIHAVPLFDGLRFFGELIEGGDHWIFAADFVAKDLLMSIFVTHYSDSLPGDTHSLVLPMTAPPIMLIALRKSFMSPKQLGNQLRQHASLTLSPAELAARDVFIIVAGFRIPFVVELIKHLTGEGTGAPIFGCPN